MKTLVSTDLLGDLLLDITDACLDTARILDGLVETTENLLLDGIWTEDRARDRHGDIAEAARGNTRVACQWCDGEFHVPIEEPGPHTCWMCRHCDGY